VGAAGSCCMALTGSLTTRGSRPDGRRRCGARIAWFSEHHKTSGQTSRIKSGEALPSFTCNVPCCVRAVNRCPPVPWLHRWHSSQAGSQLFRSGEQGRQS
jgi:hypothetical protein